MISLGSFSCQPLPRSQLFIPKSPKVLEAIRKAQVSDQWQVPHSLALELQPFTHSKQSLPISIPRASGTKCHVPGCHVAAIPRRPGDVSVAFLIVYE